MYRGSGSADGLEVGDNWLDDSSMKSGNNIGFLLSGSGSMPERPASSFLSDVLSHQC
jgi:hypothetical protein